MTGLLARKCPARGCPANVPASKFMCPHHWGKVPADLKRAVYAAWRKYQTDPRAHAGELRAAQQDALEGIQ